MVQLINMDAVSVVALENTEITTTTTTTKILATYKRST
jgi:hypothetical protein